MNIVSKQTSHFHLIKRHFAEKSDRIILYSAVNTIPNTFFSCLKIGVGLFYFSFWFLAFGAYYLVLLAIRLYFLRVYHKLQTSTESLQERVQEEKHYLVDGGLCHCHSFPSI